MCSTSGILMRLYVKCLRHLLVGVCVVLQLTGCVCVCVCVFEVF